MGLSLLEFSISGSAPVPNQQFPVPAAPLVPSFGAAAALQFVEGCVSAGLF
jgi:hypothetical protein